MSTTAKDYEQLLRDALVQSKMQPTAANDLNLYASNADAAIYKVTNGAANLELVLSMDEFPARYDLRLRRRGINGVFEEPRSDLGVYQLSEEGYPIRHWNSIESWRRNPAQPDLIPLGNKQELEDHFRWLISSPSSRLVVLVSFIMEHPRGNSQGERPA